LKTKSGAAPATVGPTLLVHTSLCIAWEGRTKAIKGKPGDRPTARNLWIPNGIVSRWEAGRGLVVSTDDFRQPDFSPLMLNPQIYVRGGRKME